MVLSVSQLVRERPRLTDIRWDTGAGSQVSALTFPNLAKLFDLGRICASTISRTRHAVRMRTPSPLPRALSARAFAVAESDALGVPRSRLRASDLRTPFRGTRSRAEDPPADLLTACLEYAPRLADHQFYSHATALALRGIPLPSGVDPTALHVATHRPNREPRIPGIVGHRLQRRAPSYTRHPSGFLVENPVRAWRQVGYTWPHDALVAAADHMISPRHTLVDARDLEQELEEMGDMRGHILRSALGLSRIGSESPRETDLRLMIVRFGLPEPELNQDLFDARGTFVARLDLSYRRWKVAVEYDGRQHAEDPHQFEIDTDRWDSVRREGWTLVRILNHHMKGDAPRAPLLVRDALWHAGWR